MEVFYLGWEVIQMFLAADAQVPTDAALPRPPQRTVARYLADRREFPVIAVVDALAALAQPELLETSEEDAGLVCTRGNEAEVTALIAPEPKI